jgi:hypothetical protein
MAIESPDRIFDSDLGHDFPATLLFVAAMAPQSIIV